MELGAFEESDAGAVFTGAGEADGFTAEVVGGLGVEALLDEVPGVGEGEGLRRGDVGVAGGGSGLELRRGNEDNAECQVDAGHAPNDTATCGEGTRLL